VGETEMKKNLKLIISAIVLIGIIAFSLIYTLPMTIEQRYPYLDASKCTQIQGYYFRGTDSEDTWFVINSDDPHFDELIEIIQSSAFKTKLLNILPQGTKTYRYGDDDFKWNLMLLYEDVYFPDGSTGSGHLLHIDNFFGDLSITSNGEQVCCSVNNQGQWLKNVMSIISQYAVE